MNNFNTYSISKPFECITHKPNPQTRYFNFFKTKIDSIINSMIAPIVAGKEPKIWFSFDQQGNRYWNAYDPQSNRSVKNLSETEMRVWLEERY